MTRTRPPQTSPKRVLTCTLAAAGTIVYALTFASPASAVATTQTLRDVDAASVAATLAGAGITITDAVATGSSVQTGTYAHLDLGQPAFAAGAALSSGSLIDADPTSDADVDFTRSALAGPNDSLTTSGDFGGAGDAALTALTGQSTYDAATLTFTAVSDGPNIRLSYILGSEEYAGWSSRNYGDAAAIWVNGQLCSSVPGGSAGTATVNATTNADLYNSNVDGASPGTAFDTEFNGFSDALTCTATVKPGAKNTVRVAVADTRDGQGDTTLLLAADSLTSAAPPATPAPVPTTAPTTPAPVPTTAPTSPAPVPTTAPATPAPVPTTSPAPTVTIPGTPPATGSVNPATIPQPGMDPATPPGTVPAVSSVTPAPGTDSVTTPTGLATDAATPAAAELSATGFDGAATALVGLALALLGGATLAATVLYRHRRGARAAAADEV